MASGHMATPQSQSPAGGNPARAASPAASPEAARAAQARSGSGKPEPGKAELSLIPASQPQDPDGASGFPWPVMQLPVELDVAIPVRAFRVRTLLALAPGRLIETRWPSGEDMP